MARTNGLDRPRTSALYWPRLDANPLTDGSHMTHARSARVAVIEPDTASRAAMGVNPLDPSTREPSARAGRPQGRTLILDWT